jgi:hypothetical protein
MMSWSDERKAKANETRRRNKKARTDELAGLHQQIADLAQMNADLSKNLFALQQEHTMPEVSRPASTPAKVDGSGDFLEMARLAEASAQRVLGLLAEALNAAANKIVYDDPKPAKEPVEQTKVTVRNLTGNNNADLTKMTVQELNATAIDLKLQTDFHRERLIQRITEAREASAG